MLKVVVHPTMETSVNYPVFYAEDGGVRVGKAGELTLVSMESNSGTPLEFRIYAPGTWKEVNSTFIEDED